jgi:hypothetical protein
MEATHPIVVPSDDVVLTDNADADDLLLHLIRRARAERKNLLLLFNSNLSAKDVVVVLDYNRITHETIQQIEQLLSKSRITT